MAKYREDYTDPVTGEIKTNWTLRPRLIAIHFNPRMPPDANLPIDPYPFDPNRGAQPVTGTRASDLPKYIEARVRGNPQIIEELSNKVYYPASAFFNDWLTSMPFLSRHRIDFRADSFLIDTPCFPASEGGWVNLPSWLNRFGVSTWDRWFYTFDKIGWNKEPADSNYDKVITRSVDIGSCLRDPRPFFDPFLQKNVMGGHPNILEAVNSKYVDWLLVLGRSFGATFYGEAAMYGPNASIYPSLAGPWKCQEIWNDSISSAFAQDIYSYNTGLKHYIFVPFHSAGLRVFDITTSGTVTEVAHFPAIRAKDIYAPYPDTTLYMTDATSDESGALYVLDISDLGNGNITMKQWLPFEHGYHQHGVVKSGNYVVVQDGFNIRAVNISDLSYTDTPFVTTVSGGGISYPITSDKKICPRLFTTGNYVIFPTTGTFEVCDISALPTITWKNYISISGIYGSGKFTNSTLYFTSNIGTAGVFGSVNFANPLSPSLDGYSSTYSGETFLGLDVSGSYAYVITSLNLRIFPTATPYNQVGSVGLNSSNTEYSACFYKYYGPSDERLFVISKNGIIDVYNVTNKSAPAYIGTAYDCTADANALDNIKGYILTRRFASVYGELNVAVDPTNLSPAGGNFWESFCHWIEWNIGKFWYTHPDDGGLVSTPAAYSTYGNWQNRQNPTATAYPNGSGFTDWDWFRITDKEIAALIFNGNMDYNDLMIDKRAAGCGRPHLPPNASGYLTYDVDDLFSLSEYDYSNTGEVLTASERWETYPNLSGDLQTVNAQYFIDFIGVPKMGSQEAWEKWWLYFLPHADGTHADGKHINNWWDYIFNFQEYVSDVSDPDYGAYSAAGEIGSAPSFDSALGQL